MAFLFIIFCLVHVDSTSIIIVAIIQTLFKFIQITLHQDKYKNMTIGKPANTDYNLVAYGITTAIENVECVKDNGITLDSKLDFDRHIDQGEDFKEDLSNP